MGRPDINEFFGGHAAEVVTPEQQQGSQPGGDQDAAQQAAAHNATTEGQEGEQPEGEQGVAQPVGEQGNPEEGQATADGQEGQDGAGEHDEDSLFPDFGGEAAAASQGEPQVATGQSTQTQQPDFWGEISRELGGKFQSVSDLKEAFSAKQKELVPKFDGYSDATSQLINSSLEDGFLTPEEISTGTRNSSFFNEPKDVLAFNGLKDRLQRQGKFKNDEQVDHLLSEMDPDQVDSIADSYADRMDAKADAKLTEIRSQMRIDEFSRAQQVQAMQAERNKFFKSIDDTVSSMEEIPGTGVKLTPEMKVAASRYAKSILDLPKNHPVLELLGNPGQNGDPRATQVAISQILRLRYGSQIQKVAATRGRNDGIRDTINKSTSQPGSDQRPQQNGTSIGAQPGTAKSWAQSAEGALDAWRSGS